VTLTVRCSSQDDSFCIVLQRTPTRNECGSVFLSSSSPPTSTPTRTMSSWQHNDVHFIPPAAHCARTLLFFVVVVCCFFCCCSEAPTATAPTRTVPTYHHHDVAADVDVDVDVDPLSFGCTSTILLPSRLCTNNEHTLGWRSSYTLLCVAMPLFLC